jgi:hypothetical protein
MVVRAPALAICLSGWLSSGCLASDKLEQCREFGIMEFAGTAGFKTIRLADNGVLFEDKFNAWIGSQYVSDVIHGEGALVLESGASAIRFICLHAGAGKGPVFFYVMPAG